jgi:NAD(P)-dependent dehydrogenase (short-subunit alcohol dehydrogenase family)
MTYHVSKAAENAITMILARENPQFLINCCCPGWVDTELGTQAGQPPKTVGKTRSRYSLPFSYKPCALGTSFRVNLNR